MDRSDEKKTAKTYMETIAKIFDESFNLDNDNKNDFDTVYKQITEHF